MCPPAAGQPSLDRVRKVNEALNVGATAIHASWIVAFDGTDHRLLENGVVVFRGNRIIHVGRSFEGAVEKRIDARGRLLIPGLISTHAHVGAGYGDRLIVDGGRRDLLRTGFLNYEPVKVGGGPAFTARTDPDAAIRYGFGLLLRHGVTTVVEMGGGLFDGGETMVRRAGECGIRLYYGPSYNPGRYEVDGNGRISRIIEETRGLRDLDRAGDFIARHAGAHGGRFQGLLIPDEAFNCTPAILERTRTVADALGVGITLHVAEQVYEFHEALRRTGRTPVRLLEDGGVLRPRTILGHCRFTGGNSQTAYAFDDDLDRLAQSGATVAHAPMAGMRRGGILESFQRYHDRGVKLSIGTDTYPLDMIAEMRAASMLGKIADRNVEAANAAAVFRAATLGGADALGRTDIGRLAPGAKADLVLLDFNRLRVGPVYDPIRSLLHAASSDCVETVVVDGRTVVEGGRVLAWDIDAATAEVRAGVEDIRRGFSEFHWSGKNLDEVFPPSLPPYRSAEALLDA